MKTLFERLIDKTRFDLTSGCLIWEGTRHSKTLGYGRICVEYKDRYAHRLMYEEMIGPIPDGYELDHLCRDTMCVNPLHLDPVTHKVNMSRSIHTMKTHCPYGHEYTKANTRYKKGHNTVSRNCRACQKIRNDARYRRTT